MQSVAKGSGRFTKASQEVLLISTVNDSVQDITGPSVSSAIIMDATSVAELPHTSVTVKVTSIVEPHKSVSIDAS